VTWQNTREKAAHCPRINRAGIPENRIPVLRSEYAQIIGKEDFLAASRKMLPCLEKAMIAGEFG
jgi:hypothetical protein